MPTQTARATQPARGTQRRSPILLPAASAAVLFLGLLGGGCTYNETTEEWQFDLLSRSEEIRLGSQFAPELTEGYGGAVTDEGIDGYVSGVGTEMARLTEGRDPELPWEFTLLDSDVVNAFALPGGKVFISRALAREFVNEAELASVLGHEIGHVTARHANEGAQRQAGLQVGVAAVGAILTGTEAVGDNAGAIAQGVGQAGAIFALRYDRRQELEADELGIRYMTLAGYNPVGSYTAMQTLASLVGRSPTPEFLSTHPDPAGRVERIKSIVEEEHPTAFDQQDRGLFAERYRRRLLEPMASLPPPAPPPEPSSSSRGDDRDDRSDRRFDLARASTWCAVCNAQATPASTGIARSAVPAEPKDPSDRTHPNERATR